ncbi:predicted protein [Naegleria gruberi]|uniref:Predicted protein n=1 Tax=Naegleria gruberi TaxID=5762 RepID=D2VTH5_NAEGR|nr:uncharacterized protein NAEGRDRAFT_72304 [Naegleria gruberi]EFC39935.1 predicted protein [Naegleria gruberi]|eukprot:XP_002672679.1 predicted protein [Naegleria gruberi strain NEG-M]
MAKQTQHGRYPVKGKEVAHDKFSSMACNLVSGFVPLASMALMNYAGVGIMTQMVTLSPVYLFLGGRWTLGYLTRADIAYRKKQIMKIDPDYWFKSSPNRWILFKRSSIGIVASSILVDESIGLYVSLDNE